MREGDHLSLAHLPSGWLDLGKKINPDQIWSRFQACSSVPEVLFPEHTLDKRRTYR